MWVVTTTKFFILLSLLLFSFPIQAMNGRTTYQAKISKPDGYPLEAASVNFRFTVLDTVGSCILYVEDYAAINMQDTGGLVSFALGNGSRAFPTSGTSQTFQNIFDNSVASFPCQNSGIYNPGANDTRRVVMQFNEGVGWQTLPAMTINSVPYSMYANTANSAKTLNNKADTAFVEYTALAGLNCQSHEAISFNGVSFGCIAVSGISVSGSVLAISGTASAPVISMSAASMSSDGYLNSSDYAEFKAKVSNISATAPLASTGGSTPTISITQATSASNGYLSATDWATFNNKQAALGFTPLDSAVSGTFAVKTNNLSDLTNVATARNNLGLGTLAVGNSIDLGSASATGIINEARFANRSGVTSGTQYTKVTVDGKGFVTNGSQISAGDVTAALGYTPASASASTQWSTSGTTINYTAGNVGVGTSAPLAPLHIRRPVGSSQALLLEGDSATSGNPKITFLDLNGGSTEGHLGFDVTNGFSMMGGKLGLGTTTPNVQLQVNGASTLATIQLTTSSTGSAAADGTRLQLSGTSFEFRNFEASPITFFTANTARMQLDPSGNLIASWTSGGFRLSNTSPNTAVSPAYSFSDDEDSGLFNPVTGSLAFSTEAVERMRIDSSGKVGIGTTAPNHKLEINGGDSDLVYQSSANAGLELRSTAATSAQYIDFTGSSTSTVGSGSPDFQGRILYDSTGAANNMQFYTNANERMRISGAGNVGVGTVTPATKLDVAGQIKSSMGTPLVNPPGEAVDFVTGNTQYVTFSVCTGTITINLYSMFEGGSYSIVVVAPNGCIIDFTGTTHQSGGSGGTPVTAFKYPAGQKFSSTGNPMVYSFLRANNFVFVAQVVDFQ